MSSVMTWRLRKPGQCRAWAQTSRLRQAAANLFMLGRNSSLAACMQACRGMRACMQGDCSKGFCCLPYKVQALQAGQEGSALV